MPHGLAARGVLGLAPIVPTDGDPGKWVLGTVVYPWNGVPLPAPHATEVTEAVAKISRTIPYLRQRQRCLAGAWTDIPASLNPTPTPCNETETISVKLNLNNVRLQQWNNSFVQDAFASESWDVLP